MAYVVGFYLVVALLITWGSSKEMGQEKALKMGLLWPVMILGWALPLVVIFIVAALFATWTGDLTRSLF